MEEYLKKRMYVYRKSYKYFLKCKIGISLSKAIFATSSLSGIAVTPLFAISAISVIIEILDNEFKTSLKLMDRVEEYKLSFNFYCELLHLFEARQISEEEIHLREKDFIKNLKYFPREKYLKQMKINGYSSMK